METRHYRNMETKHSHSKPKVVLLSGIPGTGKTTLSQLIADHFSWEHIAEDENRANPIKSVCGVPE